MKYSIPVVLAVFSSLSSVALCAEDLLLQKLPAVFERAAVQYKGMLEKVEQDPNLPRTTKADGSVLSTKPEVSPRI
jgi:hypothetical protein